MVQISGAVMAQVKEAVDAVRSHQDCAEVYSDMTTVSSSAGKKKHDVMWTLLVFIIFNIL